MDRLQNQDTYDPVELVQKYIRDTASADDLVSSDGIVEHLFFKVKHLFASILLLVKHCDSNFKARIQNNSLDRSYSRLVLWYDAYQLLLGTRKSGIPSDLAGESTKYLKSIGLILVDRLILLLSKASVRLEIDSLERHVLDVSSWIQKVGNLGGDDGSDTSSNFDYDSYADVAEDLKTDTACLIGVNTLLSTALNAPSIDTAWDTTVGRWEPHQPYCDRISNRFPDGIESLIARLGKANYERYLRCIQKREEDHDDQNDDRADTVVASDFHDSGLGSSIPGKSTYAETVMSYGGDGSQQTVRVPPLSAEARKGKPFTCIACSRTVTISNNSLWKRHLYEDLSPWLCLEPTCSSGSYVFSRRDDWVAHLAFEHHLDPAWEGLQCPLCRDQIESGKASITRHLGGHLEEIALGSLPVQTDLENNSEEGSFIAGSNRSTKSSDVWQTSVDTNVSAGATTDLPPPLSHASSLPANSLQQGTPPSEIPLQVVQYDPYGSTPRTSRGRIPSSLRGQRRSALQDKKPRERVTIDSGGNLQGRFLEIGASERTRRVVVAATTQQLRTACLYCRTWKHRCEPSENNPLGACKRCIRNNRECGGLSLAPPAFDAPSKPPNDGDRTSERRSDVDIVGEKIAPSSSPSPERHSNHVVSDEPSSPLRSLPTYDAPEQDGHERTNPILG